jgi:hypothetical protein
MSPAVRGDAPVSRTAAENPRSDRCQAAESARRGRAGGPGGIERPLPLMATRRERRVLASGNRVTY